MNARRAICEKWCSMAILIAFTAVMIAASIMPALAAILPDPANLANTTGNHQTGGD